MAHGLITKVIESAFFVLQVLLRTGPVAKVCLEFVWFAFQLTFPFLLFVFVFKVIMNTTDGV